MFKYKHSLCFKDLAEASTGWRKSICYGTLLDVDVVPSALVLPVRCARRSLSARGPTWGSLWPGCDIL